jgi:RHS repeat-associated protein
MSAARTTSYTYDQLKRLSSAQTVDLTSPGTWRLQFAYDRYGNRLSQTPTGGTASMPSNSVAVDPTTNRITTAGYDADGNMTNDGVNVYTFDAESRITQVNGTANTYAYDGSGLRVNRNGNYYIYSGGRVIAEYANGAPAASPTTEHVYARGKRVATIAGGATSYPYWDHLSIRASANSSGAVIRTFGHYPFGETWYETGAHDKWGYTTYENDAESGLNYAIARFHNPRLGRFMSLDPWPGDKHRPQSWNRYTQDNNNPASFSDPSGMDGCDDEGGDCGGDEGGGDGTDAAAMEDGGGNGGGGGGDGAGDNSGGDDGGAKCGDPNTACDSHGKCLMGDCMPSNTNDNNPTNTPDNTDPSQQQQDQGPQQDDQQQQPDQQQEPGQQSDQQQANQQEQTNQGSEHSDLHVAGNILEATGAVIFIGCQIAEPCGAAVDTIGGAAATIGWLFNVVDENKGAPGNGNVPGTKLNDPVWFLGLGGH